MGGIFMNQACTFYVVRHGQTMFNLLDQVQGWSDTPLTPRGEEMADQLGRGLREVPFTAAYCSDSGRAVATAERILAQRADGGRDLTLHRDPRLREWCLGSLEGGPNRAFVDLMRAVFPGGIKGGTDGRRLPEVAGLVVAQDTSGWAEDFPTIEARLDGAFRDMAAANPGGVVLVVAHALVIKSLIYHFDLPRVSETDFVANASVTTLLYQEGRFRAGVINDTHYLTGAGA